MSAQPAESPESAYLDAARACIVDVGWRRATLTEIARRAGVSRMTIYRSWPDTTTLLSDLLVREWAALLSDSGLSGKPEGTARDAVVGGVTGVVAGLRRNELFRRIIELDPELLHPYLFHRRGRNQQWMLELLTSVIRDGQADGSIRVGSPAALARVLLLAAYGFALSAPTMTDRSVGQRTLDAELRALVERYLAP